ncbi:MAG: PDZ domain-containing protein [Zavarzinella sp.]
MKWMIVGAALCISSFAVNAEEPKKKQPPTFEVPYRLTDTKHVLVRAKINNKGPFNFIIDTGAPAMIMTEEIAKKVGAKTDKGWADFDSVVLEGGLKLDKPRGLAIDMFQLKGMNSMGLAGCELHGVIGYNILSRYRIVYDFNEDKLLWTPVDIELPEPKRITGKEKDSGQSSLEMMGTMMKFLAAFSGIKPNYAVNQRGFVGAELGITKEGVIVKQILANSPAAKSGLQVGDLIVSKGKIEAATIEKLLDSFSKLGSDSIVALTVLRGGKETKLEMTLGKGI